MAHSLDDIEALIKDQRRPPVQDWQPDREAEMEMRIERDGRWYYQGSEIARESLVRLFSTILRLEEDGRYCLVTPAEKLFIQVAEAPFIATCFRMFDAMEDSGKTTNSVAVFETNVGDSVIVSEQHPVWVETDADGHPRPYLHVRSGLNALLSRPVYYQLIDVCVEYDSSIGFWSKGRFHSMHTTDASGSNG